MVEWLVMAIGIRLHMAELAPQKARRNFLDWAADIRVVPVMLVVRVELHSAITGQTTEIARMIIANDGTGTYTTGNYWGEAARGVTDSQMLPHAIHDPKRIFRRGTVRGYARNSLHVWNLVARMLASMGFK